MNFYTLILKIVAQFFMIYIFLLTTNINIKKGKLSIKTNILLFFSCLSVTIALDVLNPGNKTFLYILNILPIYFICRNILKYPRSSTITVIFLLYVAISISEISSFVIIHSIFKMSLEKMIIKPQVFGIYFIIKYVILSFNYFAINKFIQKNYKDIKRFIIYLNDKKQSIIPLFTISMLIPMISILTNRSGKTSIVSIIIYDCFIVSIALLSFLYFKYMDFYSNVKETLSKTKLYNRTLNELVDNLRVMKHDYNNTLQAINGYIATNQYDKLKEHMKSITTDATKISNMESISPLLINQPAIYGVIGNKYYIAKDKNISFHLEVLTDISTISFDFSALSKILGILLDNAIEASSKSSTKEINIKFTYNKLKNADMIEIDNTITDNLCIDMNNIYKKGSSSKKSKSGLGLWEVKKLISKRKNSQIFASVDQDFFSQTLVIEKV